MWVYTPAGKRMRKNNATTGEESLTHAIPGRHRTTLGRTLAR